MKQDLYKRIPSAIAYIVLMLGGLYFQYPFWLVICSCLLFVASFEWAKILRYQNQWLVNISCIGIFFIFLYLTYTPAIIDPLKSKTYLLPLIIFIFYGTCYFIFRRLPAAIAMILGLTCYLLPAFYMLFQLGNNLPTYTLILFTIIWSSDTFAYMGGKLWGRTKLAPAISPGKTREGAIIGIFCASIFTYILVRFIFSMDHALLWLPIGLIIAIFGILGDLFESKIKRRNQIKDSGSIFPGHGGILDRMDSILFALPIYYICMVILKL